MENFSVVPIVFISEVHSYPTNRGSRSEMIELGNPCTFTTLSKNARATASVSVLSFKLTNANIFEKWSTTTKTVEVPVVVGTSVKKSIDMFCHGTFPTSIGYNKPLVAVVSLFVL